MDYKNKYLKYKNKYLKLKKLLGGFKWEDYQLKTDTDIERLLYRLYCFAGISYKDLDEVKNGLYFLLKEYILNNLLP